jgi:hypothetical protein
VTRGCAKPDPKDHQAHLDRVNKVGAIAKARREAGRISVLASVTVTFYRLQAEEWLVQGKTFTKHVLSPVTARTKGVLSGVNPLLGEAS